MLWFFEKHYARLHYEVRRQTDGPYYELVITQPDGGQEIETFADTEAVIQRSAALHESLVKAGWQPPRPVGSSDRAAKRPTKPHAGATASAARPPRAASSAPHSPDQP